MCRTVGDTGIELTMAYQPIVRASDSSIFAYEALVRGPAGQGAGSILSQVTDDNRYAFDQRCRVTAIDLACQLGIGCVLSINFLPNAVYEPAACIRATLNAAQQHGLPNSQLMFEVCESEQSLDHTHLQAIFAEYKRQGFATAIDDFGAGHSGLNMLAEFEPDVIKLDMALTRDIDSDDRRQAIVEATLGLCSALDIKVIAEGIESAAEFRTLRDLGIDLFQGYLFAKPGFENLPTIDDNFWSTLGA